MRELAIRGLIKGGWAVLRVSFADEVEALLGPYLRDQGFTLDAVDDRPDAGGRERHIVFYKSDNCKLQVYKSDREGESNCMIAPRDAPNEFGLDGEKWQFVTRFVKRPNLPLDELYAMRKAEYDSYANPLEWLRDRLTNSLPAARDGIRAMYPEDTE